MYFKTYSQIKNLGYPKTAAETFPSTQSFMVIVKKSKHKLLLLQSYQNLLCSDMCSGLKINDLVISPSRPLSLNVMLHLFTTRSAFGLKSLKQFPLRNPKSVKKLQTFPDDSFFIEVTRNTVNMMTLIMRSPVVSEVIEMFNGTEKEAGHRLNASFGNLTILGLPLIAFFLFSHI